MSEKFDMLAKTFLGLEGVLADELRSLGATDVTEGNRAVMFTGDKAMLYRANFACRTAVRVLKPFLRLQASSAEELYEQVKHYDWGQLMTPSTTFAIDSTVYSEDFTNSRFVTYRVKDAIVDWFSEREGRRPSIRIANPDLKLDVHISGHEVTLSLDSSGDALSRRGWRVAQTAAPINEVLAAGIILLSGWRGESDLVDPMCGSGTFLIEAALIGANTAPGIYRKGGYAFQRWADYDADLFAEIAGDDSAEREFTHKIYGSDIDGKAIAMARANVKSAGVSRYVELAVRDIADIEEAPAPGGVIVTNPPYGERLRNENIEELYWTLGNRLKRVFKGYQAWVVCSNEELTHSIGLKPSVQYRLNNGGLDCDLLEYVIFDGSYDEMRSRGEHIRNEDFRASQRSLQRGGGSHAPRSEEGGDERPRKRFGDREGSEERPRKRFGDREGSEERPRRRFGDREGGEERPRRRFGDREGGEERPRRRFGDREGGEERPRRRFGDRGERHSEEFAKRMLADRKPRLGADMEVPIVHGRRKSWKRRDLEGDGTQPMGNADAGSGDTPNEQS